MALSITNISVTTTSISFIANSVPPEYYKNWKYQVGTGSWVIINLAESYRYNVTITGLSENTAYKVGIQARKSSDNYVYYSPVQTITTAKNTLAPTVTTSVTEIKNNSCKIKASSNYYGTTWQYSLNNGSTWTTFPSSTSVVYSVENTITGLSASTQYKIKTRCTRTYNGVVGTSGTTTITTTGSTALNSVNAVTADASTAQVTFNWTVASGTGFTHTLYIKNSGGTTLVTVTGLTGSSGSKTISLTSSQRTALLNQMPNDKSFTGTFVLRTLSGSTQIGSDSTKTATIKTTEANSKPTFTGWTKTELNSNVSNVTSDAMKTISNIRINCNTATAKNGASISKYGITLGGRTVTSTTSTIAYGACPQCGDDMTWTVWAEDSRGYRTEVIKYYTVWCYEKPEILEWSAQREDSVGTKTSLYMLCTVRTTQSNNLNAVWYRTKKGTNSWSSWSSISTSSFSYIGSVTPGRGGYTYDNSYWASLAADSSYLVDLQVRDRFMEESSIVTFSVRRGTPLMSFRDGKIGINQSSPRAALDIFDNNVYGFYLNDYLIKGGIHSWGSNYLGRYITFNNGITLQGYQATFTQDDFTTVDAGSGITGGPQYTARLPTQYFPYSVDETLTSTMNVYGGSVVWIRSRPVISKLGYGSTKPPSLTGWQQPAFWYWVAWGSSFTIDIAFFTIGWRNL